MKHSCRRITGVRDPGAMNTFNYISRGEKKGKLRLKLKMKWKLKLNLSESEKKSLNDLNKLSNIHVN